MVVGLMFGGCSLLACGSAVGVVVDGITVFSWGSLEVHAEVARVTGRWAGPSVSWVLKWNMPWWLRGLAAVGVLVLFALSAGAEAAGAVAWYATLGAAAGLWSGPGSYVLAGSTAGRYGAVLFMTVWLVLWTVSTVWMGGRLPVVLWGGRDVIEVRPGELHVRRRFRRKGVRVAVEDVRGVYLLAGRGGLMVRTPDGGVQISRLGTGEERAALASALRGVLGLPAQVMWRPALPAGFTSGHGPEGVIVVRPAGGPHEAWLIASGTATVRKDPAGSAPGLTFVGNAAELTAAPGDDDNNEFICQLVLLGEDTREPGRDRYVLLSSRDDPTGPRELGLWLATNAHIPFDDQIAE